MKLLTQLANAFRRATEGVKNLADLTVDQQWELVRKHIEQENASYGTQLENLHPHGWFKAVGRSGAQELQHWCPRCKQLSTGATAVHCSGQKRDPRPEGWRLLLLKTERPVVFI